MGGMGSQNPFDGFSVFDNLPWYWESKILSHGYQSFNFKKIEEHQFDNLKNIYEELSNINPFCSLIILGIYKSRTFFDVMFFSFNIIQELIIYNKKSLLKKDLLLIKENKMYLPIKREDKKYIVDESLNNFRDVIVNKNFLRSIELLK